MIEYIGDSHRLLATVRELIAAAERAIVLQMYLFAANGDQTLLLPREGAFPYADTVADWLIAKKRACPHVAIVVVLDSNTPADPQRTRRRRTLVRQRLERAGIAVLTANLAATRFDPRPRRLLRSMNYHLEPPRAADLVARQNRWQVLHNVEDHRKNLVIDGGRAGALTSHNFFDPAWDWHENLFLVHRALATDLWRRALASVRDALALPHVLSASARADLETLFAVPPGAGRPVEVGAAAVPGYQAPLEVAPQRPGGVDDPHARLLEHTDIRPALAALVGGAGPGDALCVATTWFSDLELLEALAAAARRGAQVRVLVDSVAALPLPPLVGALTRGLVNHAVLARAREHCARLERFELRVHDSRHGTMMHLKTAARRGRAPLLIGGQANFTPNSFNGAWLETNLETRAVPVIDAFVAHFEQLWRLPTTRPLAELPRSRLADALRSTALAAFERVGLRP